MFPELCVHIVLDDLLPVLVNWRASETLSEVYKFELVRYVYIYIYVCMEVRMS